MTIWFPRCVALLLLMLPFVPAVGVADGDTEVERLIKQLGSDEFAERETATKRLQEIGEPAFGALYKAATSADAEVRLRAEHILNKLYPELRLTGHKGGVWSVWVSADGKRVLTSAADKTLRLWDGHTGKELHVFEGHTDHIFGAALSLDGKRVLSGSVDKTVRLWDATTGKELQKATNGKELQKMTGHAREVVSVAVATKSKALFAGYHRQMYLWDLDTGVWVLIGHTATGYCVAYSDQAKLAAIGTADLSIRLLDLETGNEVRKLTGHTQGIPSVCFSADGKRLLSVSHDGTLRIWDVESGKELKQIQAHKPLYSAAFSPDGKRIVSGGDEAVRLWDAESGKELRKYPGHGTQVTSVAFFPDGRRIAATSWDGTARIWRVPP
jgi:WD40 repeat protein